MSVIASEDLLLSIDEMVRADAMTIASGTPGCVLMERAGTAVVDAIQRRWQPGRVSVLCGPGNNGGDGFVVARLLQEHGWTVRAFSFSDRDLLRDDAAIMAGLWQGDVAPLASAPLVEVDLMVDAVFGAGLSRPLDDDTAAILGSFSCPCVAVDMPSGIDGNTGQCLGIAPRASLTVTFCRAKPGHLLMPGRSHCGELVIANIGIDDAIVTSLDAKQGRNGPATWAPDFPWPALEGHKYRRGHLAVVGGGIASSGAARLAARAGLRVGAGLVTCAVPPSAVTTYAAHLTSVMINPIADAAALAAWFGDRRITACVLGPGQGVSDETCAAVLTALESQKPLVLDADALSVFSSGPKLLMDALHERCVLTPHEGEFARLFDRTGDRLQDVRSAARRSGAVVLLKGPDTVIAHPAGRALINDNAPPFLATAGSGDVLAGLIGGLLAQGMPTFHAAAAGVWLHGKLGVEGGPGLIAEDLPDLLPMVLPRLKVSNDA
jgi:hydroxyethylthiazole kinase-like uncharacterized protein yjeF